MEVAELKANLDITNRGFRSLREEMHEKEATWERERLILQSRIAAFEVHNAMLCLSRLISHCTARIPTVASSV